ncbi:MAG: type I restriction-modification system endonuclease [Firmicutes bacterium]|nr:type I restriction-modification system endonuclease [Bacillota bacterium]
MASNFAFLQKEFPVLYNFGELAEKYYNTDANSCLMKLGMIGETIVNLMFTYDRIYSPERSTAADRIRILQNEGLLTRDLVDILHELRKKRNKAAHENYSSVADSKSLLIMAYSLCEWFMQTYGDWSYESKPYIWPETVEEKIVVNLELEKQNEDLLIAEAEKNALEKTPIAKSERQKQAQKVANQRQKSEAETRYIIDEQLCQVGWEADTENLRYSKGTRPEKGRNLAIAEWPTNSAIGKKGYADYVLFVGTKMVAVIEAKAEHKDIPSVIDFQGKDYPKNIRKEDEKYLIGQWGEYKVPLTFATNGRPYLEQYKTKSGIWCLDLREDSNIPYALRGWMSPIGITELLEKDIKSGNKALEEMTYDLLQDKDGLNLREYQLNAIKAAEKAIIDGKKEILIAMATGTGKTRTVLGMIYRFLKTNRFKRILFLVDRTSLGEQTQDVFKEVKLEELMTLDEIYNIKELDEKTIDKETRIHVSTVQGMVKRVLYNDGETMPAVSDYDLIIIDEAHRGYILDKEMGKVEALYRDQRDYQSKYRSVIEYFNATKIALTATPALQTTEIFGQPVFKYTYREAVIEGYLVDHDAPHHLETKLSSGGIHFKEGETIQIYDSVTGEIVNSEELNDELDFEIEQFNRQVITEAFNETVLTEIARDIDPENPEEQGKTLIYAVDDNHADMIVDILRKIYQDTGVDNDAILKVTGSIGGGNPKKVQETIKKFKNERYPSIAVTVDLLTTGIDVPEITTLVFMRRVKSRILFEQMLGRATRLCPDIKKTHFEIYDPVGVYDALQDVSTMKPVVANPKITFTQLLDSVENEDDEILIQQQINEIVAKLQRKKKNIDSKTMDHFVSMTGGMTPEQFIVEVQRSNPAEAKKRLLGYYDVFKMLQETKASGSKPVVISNKEDELIEHSRGYGGGAKPEDYLDSFAEYIQANMNEIIALKVVCTKPRELTRESLKSLMLTLDRAGFTTQQLNTAISELTNEEMTADIISLIRRYAIGSALISHEVRIRNAVEKLRKMHNFSKQELSWIKRIEKYLMEESVLNMKAFDQDSRFKAQGGFNKINKVFQNNLESIVLELNEYLYEDGGRTA